MLSASTRVRNHSSWLSNLGHKPWTDAGDAAFDFYRSESTSSYKVLPQEHRTRLTGPHNIANQRIQTHANGCQPGQSRRISGE